MKLSQLACGVMLAGMSLAASANTGIAFVHGTGAPTDAYNDYWTGEFIQSVANGRRYTVAQCNFNKYMWDSAAAGCLAGQLTNFINSQNITRMYVITHSNGGNVMRWIMSNPSYDSRYSNIINKTYRVTALAPSSKGTPLADAAIAGNVFEQVVSQFVGMNHDATRQQQTSWMAHYNANNLYGTSGRPSLPKTFKTVVGTDVDSAVWDSDSYCGGYHNQVGMEVTQAWLDSCSDGVLNCSSQSGAGSVWFYDKDRTKGREPLSHQQSRRKCFNLDTILRADI